MKKSVKVIIIVAFLGIVSLLFSCEKTYKNDSVDLSPKTQESVLASYGYEGDARVLRAYLTGRFWDDFADNKTIDEITERICLEEDVVDELRYIIITSQNEIGVSTSDGKDAGGPFFPIYSFLPENLDYEVYFRASSHDAIPKEVKINEVYLLDSEMQYNGHFIYFKTNKGDFIYFGYGQLKEDSAYLFPRDVFYEMADPILEGVKELKSPELCVDMSPYLLDPKPVSEWFSYDSGN